MTTLDRRSLKVKIARLRLKTVLKREGMPFTRVRLYVYVYVNICVDCYMAPEVSVYVDLYM